MPPFPDITVTPDTDYRSLLDKLQRFFKAAMPFWKDVATLTTSAGLDHGLLTGLGDDDHTHYLNTARHTALTGDHVTNGDTHDHAGGDGAQIDHGGLGGLSDDDHTQYLRTDGTRELSANWDAGNFDITLSSDGGDLIFGAGSDMKINYDGTDGNIDTSLVAASDLEITCGANKTVELQNVVYEDIRITPGGFDRPGVSDPSLVSYSPGGGGTATYLCEFDKNDIASFTVQIPHCYKQGEDIKVHIHWTPGTRGNEESGNTVGWKVDYSWANVGGAFGAMSTADLSDACNGVDHEHNMTPDVTIAGASKTISSMLVCNVKRTDTGTDDTWASAASGELPMLLEIDFHFPIDTIGSRDWGTK